MIRIYLYEGDYRRGHRVHALVYIDCRIVASETGTNVSVAVREARAFLSRRRVERRAVGEAVR